MLRKNNMQLIALIATMGVIAAVSTTSTYGQETEEQNIQSAISDLNLNAGVDKIISKDCRITIIETDLKEIKTDDEFESQVEDTEQEHGEIVAEETSSNRWGIELDENEYELLAYIVMREASTQSDEGQQAVVEVIFNRIYSVEYPDTLEEVVSQKSGGKYQFSSYPTRTKYEPSEQVYSNIDKVIYGETDILPFETLYFSRAGHKGLKIQTTIDDHVFSNQKNLKTREN